MPKQCGRDVLVDKCKSKLQSQPPAQFAMELCRLIAANTDDAERVAWWLAEASSSVDAKRWLSYARWLRVFPHLTATEISP